ncbi:hypothetical protein HMN09_00884100 [Mycena chlorophos]|uniref:Exosome complex protein n=1 Tax=Mycena chlorophos TaxID=658473 RepID=A0A8H6SNZ0_MYCCL|nr:hypothetical protein HMN09_00884100 [Mycena chlorophos]
MTTDTTKLKAKIGALDASLTSLEDALEPLLQQSLPETTVGLTPLEQAKLQTLVPYLVYDLIFIYLKAQGVDPMSHPVVAELNRVKEYFAKISAAENPETRSTQLDKGAATRFIKHAITQATTNDKDKDAARDESAAGPSTSASTSTPRVPPKVTDKMRERAAYERELKAKQDSESEDDDLEVMDGDEDLGPPMVEEAPSKKKKNKGNAKAVDPEPEPAPVAGSKRRRPAIDPFAASGFGDDEPTPASKTDIAEGEGSSKKKKKKQKKEKKDEEEGSKSPKKKKKKTEV